jgi:hypothetical protein
LLPRPHLALLLLSTPRWPCPMQHHTTPRRDPSLPLDAGAAITPPGESSPLRHHQYRSTLPHHLGTRRTWAR